MKTVGAWVVGGLGLWLGTAWPRRRNASRRRGPATYRLLEQSLRAVADLDRPARRLGPERIDQGRPRGAGRRPGGQPGRQADPIDFHPRRHAGVWTWRPTAPCPADLRRRPGGMVARRPPIVLRRKEQIWTRELATGREKRITPAGLAALLRPGLEPGRQADRVCLPLGGGQRPVPGGRGGGKPASVYDKQGACEPHWSPDGKRLVYETETHICTIDPDGKKNRLVTYFGGVQRYGRFSPDGKSIVYCQGASERGPWELYIIPAQGGTPVRMTEGGSDMTPDWK